MQLFADPGVRKMFRSSGTCQTAKTRFWSWLAGRNLQTVLDYSMHARERMIPQLASHHGASLLLPALPALLKVWGVGLRVQGAAVGISS